LPHIETDILQRFLEKEEKALEEVYAMFYDPLVYFGEKLVLNRQAAEEIVVDVFIKVFRSELAFTNMTHLRTYLFEAVKNQSLNFLRGEKRYARHLAAYQGIIESNIENAENEQIEAAAMELIAKAVEGLPTECRRIFDLLYREHLSYQEIADRLQLKVQTVRNQNARAIAYIRKTIQTPPP
jgi:RNA polymerase sigma-70 factor (ECF subfamily)